MEGLCKGHGKLGKNITFQLFGADIAINNKLKPQIMEFNKGPDLDAKDERDKELKQNMVKDMLKVLNIIPKNGECGFIPILN